MLACTLKYALGRKSYAVHWVQQAVLELGDRLTVRKGRALVSLITNELEDADRRGENLGLPIDHQGWITTVSALNSLYEGKDHDSVEC